MTGRGREYNVPVTVMVKTKRKSNGTICVGDARLVYIPDQPIYVHYNAYLYIQFSH